jgi:hypothetical protein
MVQNDPCQTWRQIMAETRRPPCQEPREIDLAKVQRQLSQIVALDRQDVEGVELHLIIMPARMQAVEIRYAVDAEQDRLAIDDERAGLFRSAASTIRG